MNEALNGEMTEGPQVDRPVRLEERTAKEWKPSRQECLREYRVDIEFLSIGCIIRVGCKSIPFATITEGMKAVNDYVANPYETRKIWEERFAKDEL
jgi:hypothetical protein